MTCGRARPGGGAGSRLSWPRPRSPRPCCNDPSAGCGTSCARCPNLPTLDRRAPGRPRPPPWCPCGCRTRWPPSAASPRRLTPVLDAPPPRRGRPRGSPGERARRPLRTARSRRAPSPRRARRPLRLPARSRRASARRRTPSAGSSLRRLVLRPWLPACCAVAPSPPRPARPPCPRPAVVPRGRSGPRPPRVRRRPPRRPASLSLRGSSGLTGPPPLRPRRSAKRRLRRSSKPVRVAPSPPSPPRPTSRRSAGSPLRRSRRSARVLSRPPSSLPHLLLTRCRWSCVVVCSAGTDRARPPPPSRPTRCVVRSSP